MAQAGSGAFSTLDQRKERQEEQAQAGLDKVFQFQGVSELYSRMKLLYGRFPAWSALMKCNAIYLKDVKTAIGVDGTRYGLFFADTPTNPTWSPDIGANLLTINEKACLDAQNAKHERLQSSLKTTSSLVHQVMEKTKEARTYFEEADKLQKKIDNLHESNRLLHRKIQEKHKDTLQNMMVKLYDTQKDRDAWVRRCAYFEEENLNLRRKLKEKENSWISFTWDAIGWIVIAILVFGMITLADANNQTPTTTFRITPKQAEFMTNEELLFAVKKFRLTSCEEPKKGCVMYNAYFDTKEMSFLEVLSLCEKPNWLPSRSFNETRLQKECEKFFGKFWCHNKLVDLIPYECQEEHVLKLVQNQISEFRTIVVKAYQQLFEYRLDIWITSLFSLVLAGKKDRLIKMFPFIALSWFFRLPIFLVCVAVNLFPLTSLPFVAVQLIFPQYIMINAFLMWIVLTLVAFYWNEGPKILVEISFALLYTVGFIGWSIAIMVGTQLNISLVYQILFFCIITTTVCGTKFACSTITVQNPDGTTTKYTRFGKMKTTVANQCKRVLTVLQTRGVIPSTPTKTASIVIVEGKSGAGVGFRFMNYILTAEHVVQGSDIATIKYGTITVKSKVIKTIPIFECVDNVAVIKLPSELNGVKPIKLAKKIQSDYLTLTAFDPNFQHTVTYTGWCIIDGNWLNNSFDTKFGNSGGPYCDCDGRLVGMHLGTQGVLSQGVVIAGALRSAFQIVEQSTPQGFDMEEFMERVIAGTKTSHVAILKELEELREEIQFLKKRCGDYDEYWLMQAIFGQKKGKTKKTIRGQKHLVTKRALSKGHFMKMRMLTDEEYNNMIEKGFTAEEIREAVNALREQAWLNYCIDNDIDEEGEEEWYDDLAETERINREIDEAVERAMEDRGEYYEQKKRLTFVEQAMMHLIKISKERSQTAKLEVQQENGAQLVKMFEKVVTDRDVPEGTTSVAVLPNGEDVRLIENKDINFEKVKNIPVDNEIKKETIPGTKVTEISTGPENKENILKKKDTHMLEEKKNDVQQEKPVILEQRKPRACKWCGSTQKHDYRDCRMQREKRFCVFCATMHSMFDGHVRPVECNNCKKTFQGIEKLEDHVIRGECQKN
uniref:Non-structural polyprotein n=1 Tax=Duck astrovirus TaxID=1239441 RepID=A0A023PPT0_9VIRU|nr:non-structural polyprotein [Duck astrovirus]